MRQLPKRLLAGLAGILCFTTAATALTLVVDYKPFGVPDHRRAEFEQKIADINRRQALLQGPPPTPALPYRVPQANAPGSSAAT